MGVALVPVARTDEVAEGGMTPADMGGRQVLLTRVDGQFYAFARECPHQATDLTEGEIVGKRVRCEAHNYWFELESGTCVMPAGGPPLAVLPVEQQGDQLFIRLEW